MAQLIKTGNWGIAGFLILLFTACNNETTVNKAEKPPFPVDETVLQTGQGAAAAHGQLRIDGLYVLNEQGKIVTLEGMSLFWHQWEGGKYYNYDCLKWLRDDWRCDIVRAAIAVDYGGYLEKPDSTRELIFSLIEACIDLDLYIIVDWHTHQAEKHQEAAIDFYTETAKRYGHHPNIIYEIYNEPLKVSWKDTVKPYLEAVVSAIRRVDPDNIIIVGSPRWSQDVDTAAMDPVAGDNIAYAIHYYAGTHKEWLRKKARVAMNRGLPLWVTEFGMCNSDGNGPIDYAESETWFDFMEKHYISWCKWSVVEKAETSAALRSGASERGGWNTEDLTESGAFIRKKLREVNGDG